MQKRDELKIPDITRLYKGPQNEFEVEIVFAKEGGVSPSESHPFLELQCSLPLFQTGCKLTTLLFNDIFQGSRSLEDLGANWHGANRPKDLCGWL